MLVDPTRAANTIAQSPSVTGPAVMRSESILPELTMDDSTCSLPYTGVVPAVCDAEAGDSDTGLSVCKIRSVIAELCVAIRSALDDERGTAEDSLRRAVRILEEMGGTIAPTPKPMRGGLAPWQIRKVASHVEAHLDQPIRNEDLAALVRLNPSHFGRAFRNSFGEPPHEYVIRRRIERAQGLMLSTEASLSEIALNCGLADQSHLTRLFRRFAGESPRAWRRARIGASSMARPASEPVRPAS
jgi:AraC-like DNA-binding protein